MNARPIDECLAASTDLIARTRGKLAEMQFSVDTCLSRIEISAGVIAASKALLAKLDGGSVNGVDGDAKLKKSPASEQTIDGSQ